MTHARHRKHSTDLEVLDKFRAAGRRNPRGFIEKKLFIRTKDARLQPLVFNESQAYIWGVREKNLAQGIPFYPLILKSRQRGISTFSNGLVFERAYNNDNISALVVAHLKERSEGLFDMHHLFLKCLPQELQMPLSKAGKGVLKWDHNNSKIGIATAGTTSAGRGDTYLAALLSEVGSYPALLELLGALEQAIPELPESMLIQEGTGCGTGTDYHTIWKAAETGKWIGDTWKRGDVRYLPIFLKWWMDHDTICPDYDDRTIAGLLEQAFAQFPQLKERMDHYEGLKDNPRRMIWYWQTLADKCHGDELLMQQEYPCDPEEAFISGGQPIFSVTLTQDYRNLTREGEMFDPTISDWSRGYAGLAKMKGLKRNADTYLEVWKEPKPNNYYLISADGAEGIEGRDFSSAFVFDMVRLNVVAELHGRMEPGIFAKMLKELGLMYNQAIIAPETHGAGVAVLSALKDIYWNIYQWRKFDDFGMKITDKLGWDTNQQSRTIMITEARRMYRQRQGDRDFIPSRALIDEIRTFCVGNLSLKPVAASGCHDDRVMAWCIGIMTCLQEVGTMPNTGLITTRDSRIGPSNSAAAEVGDVIDLISNEKWTGQNFNQFYGSNE